ncbi:MAG: PssE/Cps14G family polysaccharide biosynthesis glycosyltransferase [Candidatus Woesearchaeota archaeon]
MQKIVEKILENKKKTIFVTVGNGKFDPLIKEIDRLKENKQINEEVVIQVGHGTYKPKHCKWFTFEPSLEKYYKKANLIISHGGPGIVFEVLRMKKKMIATPNRDRTDPRHQVEYLQAMAKETSALIYCDKVEDLLSCLQKAKTHKFAAYEPQECKMHLVINKFLEK